MEKQTKEKLTVYIDPELRYKAKVFAAQEKKSLSQLVTEFFERELEKVSKDPPKKAVAR